MTTDSPKGKPMTQANVIIELTKAKATFQQRAILAAMGVRQEQIIPNLSKSTPLEKENP